MKDRKSAVEELGKVSGEDGSMRKNLRRRFGAGCRSIPEVRSEIP
ncbi:MAG: hypothetical protein V1854_00355 [Methanobacteriota archaeon]